MKIKSKIKIGNKLIVVVDNGQEFTFKYFAHTNYYSLVQKNTHLYRINGIELSDEKLVEAIEFCA